MEPGTQPSSSPQLIIVGSVGLDTIETPKERREMILGGSASYACAAASFFSRTGMVGVVGSDFPERCRELYEHFGMDLEGLQVEEGKTFHWSAVYEENMDHRRTLATDLNVFEHFKPELPASYRKAPYLLLGNIAPALQLHVLDQIESPRFVMADTMDLWINIARDDLVKMVSRVDMLTLNESEARLFMGCDNLLDAGEKLLEMGPRYVLIKKGANGSMLMSQDSEPFLMHAYPLPQVDDPTGAGDTFAGGLMGALAAADDPSALRKAMLAGSVVASFGVQAFGLDRLETLSRDELNGRCARFRDMITIPA